MTAGASGEVVLAMAGHVDHGKSALVRALTGQRTDRRRAELERGLTVDLAHLVVAGPPPVAITDVPGHVDYLGNTLIGLAGGTHALLVVAADDGWMPQTEDHVRAATHLGVPIAAVAVSKTDLVDAARVGAVADDVRRRLGPDAAPPVVPVSTIDGQGLEALREVLGALSPPAAPGAPRLWVDRAFQVEGRGLVVAGTLTSGRLAVGDRVTVAPAGTGGRVRGLQQHGRPVEVAVAPGRVAIDLADAHAQRGDRVVAGGLERRAPRTDAVDAWVWGRHPAGIGDRGAWILHVGSTQVEADVDPLGRAPVPDGGDAPVHLRLARPVPLVQGDRFVLRDVGRRVVAGGGVVLDPAPPGRARGGAARRARAEVLAVVRDADDPLAAIVDADGGLAPVDRVVATVADPDAAREALAGHVVTAVWRDRVGDRVRSLLAVAGPDGRAVDAVVAEVAGELGAPAAVVRSLLGGLSGVARRDTRVVASERRGDLDAVRARALAALHTSLREAPLAPEPLDAMADAAGVAAADLDRLVRDGKLLRSGRYGFLPGAVDVVVGRLRELEERVGPFSVAEARDVLGITRKHAVPWMELLDRLGVTSREGDRRRVRPSAGSPPPSPARTGR